MSSELTLGNIRNRIDALIQRNLYDPTLPVGFVLSGDLFHEYISTNPGDRNGHRKRVHGESAERK